MDYDSITVTADNLDAIQDSMVATDQKRNVRVGDIISTWPIYYSGGQRGQMTVWHSAQVAEDRDFDGNNRGAIDTGGDSMWGDWDEDNQLLVLDRHHGDPYLAFDRAGRELLSNTGTPDSYKPAVAQ